MASKSLRAQVLGLYRELLDAWNRQDAEKFADSFADDGNCVGFDGSQMNGRKEIAAELAGIFAHHQTASYVARVREIRLLDSGAALLRAVAGMVPPGQTDLNSAANAVQSLVAVFVAGAPRIALFHNTPAAFHGRPELAARLTEELKAAVATAETVVEDD
jgi:uncharacterized protein (TIGR02246 family)